MRAGSRAPGAADLRQRLAREGYRVGQSTDPGVFDDQLAAAVRMFQMRHGLDADGVVGPGTAQELNVTAEQRLLQIDANLERWRWMPDLPADRLEVDIAAATATLYVAGLPTLGVRTIVGDPKHRTPMFISILDAIVINPPWNVPSSIASKELFPREAAQPGYLARNDFLRVDGRLQQQPGPHNALGRLKFDLKSPFGVYLHDTPGRAAFGRAERHLSHGCVRVEHPQDLALALLSPGDWTPTRIASAIDSGETSRVAIPRPTPLLVAYWTARVDDDGALQFRRDIYGWDAKLMSALAAVAR
jgi:murein L,D-transpeptidase YcbB/YkuD